MSHSNTPSSTNARSDPNTEPVMERFQTPNPYEENLGYSRAVRKGPFIFVSGTTSLAPSTGVVLYPTSAYDQTITALLEIVRAIEARGAEKHDVVRVRMYVTHSADTADVGRAFQTIFGEVRPAATMIVEVRFVDSDMMVEIEADAVTF